MGVLPTRSAKVADPLHAIGLVLLGGDQPLVLVAVDWCEIRNGAYDQWRTALAAAAKTTQERVLVCSLHQHDAPVCDRDAAKLLSAVGLANELYDESFHDDAVRRVAAALQSAVESAQPVTHIGLGQARVERVASNRRVVLDNGRVSFNRGSRSGADPFHRDAPEGLIDPFLKTISFWNGDHALLALHAYATHPMSYYGRGEVSADFVGLARRRRQRDDPSIRQIYVSGCSGDVTAGKFNDGSPDNRTQLADRLYDAMRAAWNDTARVPMDQLQFRAARLQLQFHPGPTLSEKALQAALADDQLRVEDRILAAMGLASRRRVMTRPFIDVPCIDVGPAAIVLLPGESFVHYQLQAQAMRPKEFVMAIGYGECWPGYIPTESAFAEGFHDKWLWVAPGSEPRIIAALREVLNSGD